MGPGMRIDSHVGSTRPSVAGRLEDLDVLAKSRLIPTRHTDEFQAELPLASPADRCHIDRQWCGRGLLIRQSELQCQIVACSHIHLAVHRTTSRRQVIDGAFSNLYSIL